MKFANRSAMSFVFFITRGYRNGIRRNRRPSTPPEPERRPQSIVMILYVGSFSRYAKSMWQSKDDFSLNAVFRSFFNTVFHAHTHCRGFIGQESINNDYSLASSK